MLLWSPEFVSDVWIGYVDFVRGEVLDRILLVFVGLFLSDDQLYVSQLGDGKPLCPDVSGYTSETTGGASDLFLRRPGPMVA